MIFVLFLRSVTRMEVVQIQHLPNQKTYSYVEELLELQMADAIH